MLTLEDLNVTIDELETCIDKCDDAAMLELMMGEEANTVEITCDQYLELRKQARHSARACLKLFKHLRAGIDPFNASERLTYQQVVQELISNFNWHAEAQRDPDLRLTEQQRIELSEMAASFDQQCSCESPCGLA